METLLLNHNGSLICAEASRRLLWFACLISEGVYLYSEETFYLEKNILRGYTLGMKLNLFKKLIPIIDPNYEIEQFNKAVKHYYKLKEVKYKNKNEIIQTTLLERYFKNIEAENSRRALIYRNTFGFDPLAELNESMDNKFFDLYFCPSPGTLPWWNKNPAMQTLLGTARCGKAIPVTDIAAKKIPVYKEEFSFDNYDGSLIISPGPLFSLPLPKGLSTEQLKIVRKDLMACFSFLLDSLHEISVNKDLSDFSRTDILNERGKLFASWFGRSKELQSEIDRQVYINYLRAQPEKPPELKLHIGYCSNGTLFRMYREMNIIDDSIYLYLMDRAADGINIKACTPVLVVDSEAAG